MESLTLECKPEKSKRICRDDRCVLNVDVNRCDRQTKTHVFSFICIDEKFILVTVTLNAGEIMIYIGLKFSGIP